jgi:hypothetical protein
VVLASVLAVVLTIVLGAVVYFIWVLVSAYLSLNRQLAGSGPNALATARVTRWFQGVITVAAIVAIAASVRGSLRWLGRQGFLRDVHSTAIAVGATVGVVYALFLDGSIRLSPFLHLMFDVPEGDAALSWPLVGACGFASALFGAVLGQLRGGMTIALMGAIALVGSVVHSAGPCSEILTGDSSERGACIAEEIGKLDDRSISMAAVQRLSRLAPDSIKPLREALSGGKTATVRANAADALGRIGPDPPEIAGAVPDLVAALQDSDVIVRRQAAGALGRLGSRAKLAIPALNRAAQDGDVGVQQLALFAIGRITEAIKREVKQ